MKQISPAPRSEARPWPEEPNRPQLWQDDSFQPWLFARPVGKQQLPADAPQLAAGYGDQHNHNDDRENGVGVASSFRDPDRSAPPGLGQQDNVPEDTPPPPASLNAP